MNDTLRIGACLLALAVAPVAADTPALFGDEAGFVTLGRGLVGRMEISVELLAPAAHGGGAGRRLIRAGLALVPAGSLVWGQVAPGNAASLRAFLSCGFVPIGAETLIL
jgi:RimJ/RimL family protein N-acetyltransferase